MKDLSVFDVQEALRQHRDYGHDVLSNPRQAILEGIPYQSRISTSLILRPDGTAFDNSTLKSLLMQSERPVVSLLSSSYNKNRHKPYKVAVDVGIPTVTIPHRPNDDNYDHGSHFSFWGIGSTAKDHAPRLHFRDDYDDKERWLEGLASTPHEALDNHVTSRFKTVGLHREPNGLDNFTYNLTYPQTWGDFKTPFNLKEALYDLSNFHRDNGKHLSIVPFSNHIKVYQPGMRSIDESRHYIYYPETEQLHKVGE